MNFNKSLTPAKILLCGALVLVGLLSLSSISLAQVDTCTTKAPMPKARCWFSCEVVNGKIYAIGGATVEGAPILKTVEEYDPVTDTWTTKKDMPTARYNMASAVADGKIYTAGGGHSFNVGVTSGVSTLEVYDPDSDTWNTLKPMPTAREGVSGCMIDGIIYVIGGVASGGVALKTVEAYDPVTDTWTTKAPMPTGRWALGTAVVDGKIYAMGTGQGGKTVEEYDPATDTWTSKASMLVGSGYFGTGVIDGIIYTMGGSPGPGSQQSRVFAYDPPADEWSEKPPMLTARGLLGAGVVNKKIYAIGGAIGWPLSPLSTNEEYTPPVISVGNKAINSPTYFVLHQNYPNPFNHVTNIEYTVQQSSHVKLNIYNTLGQPVRTLVDDYKTTGQYSVVWDGKDKYGQVVSSGNYYYQIMTDRIALTKKMILIE